MLPFAHISMEVMISTVITFIKLNLHGAMKKWGTCLARNVCASWLTLLATDNLTHKFNSSVGASVTTQWKCSVAISLSTSQT